MPTKVKIEMQTPDEVELAHTLPTVDEIPDAGRPVHPPAMVAAANATKKADKPKSATSSLDEFPPRWPETPLSPYMNAPLGVKKALSTASDALRARGHNILAGGVDAAKHVLPDSAADLANLGLMAYGGMKGAGEGVPEEEGSPIAAGGVETPTPPARPKLAMPEPLAPTAAGGTAEFAYDQPELGGKFYHIRGGAYDGSTVSAAKLQSLGIPEPVADPTVYEGPSTAEQRVRNRMRVEYDAARRDPRTPGGPGSPVKPTFTRPTAPGPVAETKTPTRQTIDSATFRGMPVAGAAATAGVLGAAGSADASTPDFDTKEQALMKAMAATGHPIMKVSGDRTAEEQAKLYGQTPRVTDKSGAPGDESRHQLGMAGDYAFVGPDGKPDYSPDLPWATLGRMAKLQGLEWGGDFKSLKDFGHVQLPSSAVTTATSQPGTVAAGPTPGIKVEPMDTGDHKEAKQLPVWRQVMDPLMESAPFVLGATGGMLAATAASPTAAVSGPIGPAIAATGGAYTGGVIGEGLRKIYRGMTGQDLEQPAVQTMNDMSQAGRNQMYSEMLGQGFQAWMAARAGVKAATGTFSALQTSEQHGLKLSAADLSTNPLVRGAARVMNYVSQTARTATDMAREAGDSNAVKSVKQALDNLTKFHSNLEVGTDVQEGLKSGIKMLKEGPISEAYARAKTGGPDVDLRPLINDLQATFQREGTTSAARKAILKLFPEATNPDVGLIGGTDPYNVTFEQAAKLRTRLGLSGRKALNVIGTDATSLATKLYGDVSELLNRTSPEFSRASAAYSTARQAVTNRFIQQALKASPDKIVKALGPTPGQATVEALRNTMLGIAQSGGVTTPEAGAGIQGFQSLRRSWFDTHILRNAAGKVDPAGMLGRMDKANGALRGFFGFNQFDTTGEAALQTAREIATALQKRVSIPSGNAANWAKGAELGGLLSTIVRYGYGAGLTQLGAEEVLPGAITWMMHRPAVAHLFITGLSNPNTVQGAALMGRALGAYMASGGPDADPEPDPDDPARMPVYQPPAPGVPGGTGGAKGTSGVKPQASVAPTDPMSGQAINVHTWDPDAATPQPAGQPTTVAQVQPHPAAPPELQPKPRPSAFAKATGISATPTDEVVSQQRLAQEEADVPFAVVKAVGDKIRQWGETMGSYSKGTEDWLLASLGGAFMGGTAGAATELEQQTTPSAIATGMLPIHEIPELMQLSRTFGRSAEGFPGLYSRLTRTVEALPASKTGMVPAKKVLDALKTVNPDEVAWKEVVPWIRERMGPGGNPQTPIPKQELLDHLESRKINLKVKNTGEPTTSKVTLGEPVSYGQLKTTPADGIMIPLKTEIQSGSGTLNLAAHVYPWSTPENGFAQQWQATVPRRITPGLEHGYTPPADAVLGTDHDTAIFSSQQDALDWVKARVAMGTDDTGAHTPRFGGLYAYPEAGGIQDRNYRETRITMPGGAEEGQNARLTPDTFRATSHYPDPNIVSTVRAQDYQLPRWKLEGMPDPDMALPNESIADWNARKASTPTEMVKGTLADEFQSDVHEEAKRVFDKEAEDARTKEINRRVILGEGTKGEIGKALPRRAFEKAHIEVRDPDQNGKVINRFLRPEDANRWMEAEKDNFPNAQAVPVKGIDPLFGYQSVRPDDPRVAQFTRTIHDMQAKSEAIDDAVAERREDVSKVSQQARDTLAKSLGYEDYDDLNNKAYDYTRPPEDRAKSREHLFEVGNKYEDDPEVQKAKAELIAARLNAQNHDKAISDAQAQLKNLGIKTGDWEALSGGYGPVPEFPFKDPKDWSELGLKHELLKHAATTPNEETFFATASGKENADRYNLRNHFDKVVWNPNKQELEIYKNGRNIQSYEFEDGPPDASDLRPYVGPELADKLAEKIENYEPSMRENDEGLPGTERERERADEEDYQRGWDNQYEYERGRHTVEEYERPETDENDEPILDAEGEPVTETRWRVYEDDQFDPEDPSTWTDYETERQADRGLDRMLESIMDGYEHEYSEDRYDHLDRNEEVDEDAYPTLSGLDLETGGEGMIAFYDNQIKRRVENLLKPFGGIGEMMKVAIPGKKGTSYAWVTKLTPEMKKKILEAGFSLMAVALAVKASNAPQGVKDAVMQAARKDTMDQRRVRSQRLQPQ